MEIVNSDENIYFCVILFNPVKIGGWYDKIKSDFFITASAKTFSVRSFVMKIFCIGLWNEQELIDTMMIIEF